MNKQKTNKSLKFVSIITLLILTSLVVSLILLSAVPPISRDALVHHLQIPKLYLQHGSIYELPEFDFSYYPMNLELLYMGALYLGSDVLPKYIHMIFGFGTAYLIYRYLKRRLSSHFALLGSVLFLSIPIIVKLSTTVYVDLGLVFFTTASLFLLFRWIEKGFQTRYLIWAGLCCGLAVGTKYNGLIVLFLLSLSTPMLYLRNRDSRATYAIFAIRAFLIFFLFALLAVSPWFIRNIIWTGNPIYPLYDSFFHPKPLAESLFIDEKIKIHGIFATRHILYGENLVQLFLLPIRIFFEGLDDNPRYFDGQLNPFLLLLPLFAFIRTSVFDKTIKNEKIYLFIFSLLYFLFAFNTNVLRIRYLVPMIPSLVILAMFGLHNIQLQLCKITSNRCLQSIFIFLPVALMLVYDGFYIYKQFQKVEPISYITGQVSRDEYVTKFRPEYKIMQYCNNNLPKSTKILCIFLGRRGYYLERDHVFDDNNNKYLFLSWLREGQINTTQLSNHLKHEGITHIILRSDLLSSWLQQNLSTDKQQFFVNFVNNNLVLLTSHLNYSLYKINN